MPNTDSLHWDDRLNLGVEELDKDHQRLFSIIRKILVLSEEKEEEKVVHAAKEGIKFFTSYTLSHFGREEKYMKDHNYSEYDLHKGMHDDLKNNVLPSLKQELEDNEYSIDSIRHFLGVCVGWLSTHIMMVDQTILHHDRYQRIDLNFSKVSDSLNEIMKKVIHNLYHINAELISSHYTGWDFGKALFYELTYTTGEKKSIHLLFTIEQKGVFTLASQRTGMEIKRVDAYLLALIKEILSNMTQQIAYYLKLSGEYKQRSGVMLESSEVESIFINKHLTYSSLFNTPVGKLAFSIYER